MSLSKLFERMNSPLANNRWSWGAIRSDGTVLLRVWQDETKTIEGKRFVRVTYHEKFTDRQDNLGYQERLGHVDLISKGAQAYLIMCLAKDVNEIPRQIKSYNSKDVFVAGSVCELDGDTWIEIVDRIPISKIPT